MAQFHAVHSLFQIPRRPSRTARPRPAELISWSRSITRAELYDHPQDYCIYIQPRKSRRRQLGKAIHVRKRHLRESVLRLLSDSQMPNGCGNFLISSSALQLFRESCHHIHSNLPRWRLSSMWLFSCSVFVAMAMTKVSNLEVVTFDFSE